jgi:hypothetical protein
MPGWPMPAKPIPHTEVGQVSKAGSYHTSAQVQMPVIDKSTGQATGEMVTKDVTLTGVDALAADGLDPLAGNSTLINRNSILAGTLTSGTANLTTYQTSKSKTVSVSDISGGGVSLASVSDYDATSGDFNSDGQAEQVLAYTNSSNAISLAIGEMPGWPTRITSAPAVFVQGNGFIDLVARGYDEALWHARYDGSSWSAWENQAGGTLLSAPAIASKGDGTFDVFALGADNCTYQKYYDGSAWGAAWTRVEETTPCLPVDTWVGETPEWRAPAAAANGSGLELFRLAPDNTLQWNHSTNGTTWGGWQDLGGMLATAPTVVSSGAGQLQLFAVGVDGSLWFRLYTGSWGDWQRSELSGVPAGVTFNYAPGVGSDLKVYLLSSNQQLWQSQCASTQCGVWSVLATPTDDPLASGVTVGSGTYKVFARTKSGELRYSSDGSAWNQFTPTLPAWAYQAATGKTTVYKSNGWSSDSVKIASGYFLGDGKSQLALGYFSGGSELTVAAYQTAGGFQPTELSSLKLAHSVDWFSLLTGDFLNRDGVDEIAVAYLTGSSYGLDILSFSGNVLQAAKQTSSGRSNAFNGSFSATAGDFDNDGADEIAIAWIEYSTDTYQTCPSWHLNFYFRVYDVSGNLSNETLKMYTLQDESYFYPTPAGAPGNTVWQVGSIEQMGLALASGDVNGDGRDEIVRAWPTNDWQVDEHPTMICWGSDAIMPTYKRAIQAFTLPVDSTNWDGNSDGQINTSDFTKATITTKDYDTVTVRDRLAVGDLNRDSKNEIVLTANDLLSTYYKTAAGYDNFASMGRSTVRFPTLVVDNFTRENLRVGTPTYRLQNRVDTMVAVINVPPKHTDMLKDANGDYQVLKTPNEECSPSAGDESCTHAKYAKSNFVSSEQVITTKRAYTIAGGLDASACVQGGSDEATSIKGCVTASVNYTYGNNFENTTTAINSTTFTTQVIAAQDDKVVYFGTPYAVWEYPILGEDSDQATGYMSVVFPQVSATQNPSTSSGYSNGACSETWFHAGHQVNNIWSYDPITADADIAFPNYDPTRMVYSATQGGGATGIIKFDSSNASLSSQETSHKIAASLGLEVSGTAGVKNALQATGSVKATVSGDYTATGLQTDTVTNGDSTEYSFGISEQPAGSEFTTKVVFYWTTGGYQEINYQTEPGAGAGWSLYNKPDPAFILPWYGFPDPANPQLPPCGTQKKLFTPDIVVEKQNSAGDWIPVTTAAVGDAVRLSATVRNFSNNITSGVKVRFYQGYPVGYPAPNGSNQIGEANIATLDRSLGPQQAFLTWTVAGGDQNIYAVLDPLDSILEVHDSDDLIDNNVGYGLLKIGTSGYSEMADAQKQPYDEIYYQMPVNTADQGLTGSVTSPTVSFFISRGSQQAVNHFELKDYGSDLLVAGRVFELVAYQGTSARAWGTPIPNFDLTPEPGMPPSTLSLDYAGSAYSDTLNLWRWNTSTNAWGIATCAGYSNISFPDNNVLMAPICQTGIFAFSESMPGHLTNLAPTNVILSASSVLENKPAATVVGTLTAADANAGDTAAFNLVTGVAGCAATNNGSFQIVAKQLKTKALFDFETKNSYAICVRVTDSGGLTFNKPLTIKVTNVVDEVAKNGGFELYTGTSKIPTSWAQVGFASTDGKNTGFKTGKYAVKIANTTAKTKTLTQTLSIPTGATGQKFTFSYYVKGTTLPSTGLCQGQVLLYNSVNKLVKTVTLPCGKTGTFGYTLKTTTFTTTAAYTKAVIKFTYGKTKSSVWFDVVSLKK